MTDLLTATIDLPWPPATLSPNGRPHWAQLARAKKNYRRACFALCQHLAGLVRGDGPIQVALEFCPPAITKSGRKSGASYDEDGLVSRMKSGLDGMAEAMGVDDKRFRLTHTIGEREGTGLVRVQVTTC